MKLFSKEEVIEKMKQEIAKSLKHSYIIIETRKDAIVLGFEGEGQEVHIYHSNDIGIYAYVFIKAGNDSDVSVRVSLDQLDVLLTKKMLCDHG